ncbi:uncharacterized protein LOC116526431 [Sapajus apella]|uniref:Uncharacterized protein LOC116526431 n=1 Tax=Sapajus apella TaxID=9515 RepID=A0A6J3EZ49_SAPAP|nr:uncharacterized protein LOC116526431 [Sapajus apella]
MVADPATRPGFPEPRAPARRSPAQDCPRDAAVQPGPPRPDVLTPGLSRSVRPRPGPPAGSLRGLSRSRWRWKLVGINPGREGPGLGVGEDPAPGSPRGCRGSVCAYVLGLCPSRGPSVHLPGPASSVRVAKGEATSETKVSEKERRFPAPVGAVSSSLPDRASGSAPGAPREQRWTPLGLASPWAWDPLLELRSPPPARPLVFLRPPPRSALPIPLLPPGGLGSLPRRQSRPGSQRHRFSAPGSPAVGRWGSCSRRPASSNPADGGALMVARERQAPS